MKEESVVEEWKCSNECPVKELGEQNRFFYCGKASKKEREWGCENIENKTGDRKNNHPTIKPFGIMEWLIKLITPEGEIVLDPFMGSGTTGIMCVKNSRDFIGIEMDEHYYSISQTRINYALEHYHSEEE